MCYLADGSSGVVPASSLTGDTRQVIAGLIETADGPQIAMRVGEDGEVVILPQLATSEVITNLHQLARDQLEREDSR
jgi:hypothetical protein